MYRNSLLTGISIAITWSWGSGIVLLTQSLQNYGYIPFVIMTVFNISALILLWCLYKYKVLSAFLYKNKIIKTIGIFIQFLILIVQMIVINDIIIKIGYSSDISLVITTLLGILFVFAVSYKKLKHLLILHVIEYIFLIITFISIIVYCLYIGTPIFTFEIFDTQHSLVWSLYVGCVFILSPICDIQYVRRIILDKSKKCLLYATFFFTIIEIFLFIIAHYAFDYYANIMLFVCILLTTSSTIHSVSFAIKRAIDNERFAEIIAFASCFLWLFFEKLDFLYIWNQTSIYRFLFSLFLIFIGWRYKMILKGKSLFKLK